MSGAKRHRHDGSWLIGNFLEWCYECGAIRPLRPTSPASCAVDGRWLKPTGIGGENPCDKFKRRSRESKP